MKERKMASINTLEYYEKLTAAGVSEAAARVQVEIMDDFLSEQMVEIYKNLATKDELKAEIAGLEVRMGKEIAGVRGEIAGVRTEIANLEVRMGKEIAGAKTDLIKWVTMALIGQAAVVVGILSYLE
jgi:hypothetical protein